MIDTNKLQINLFIIVEYLQNIFLEHIKGTLYIILLFKYFITILLSIDGVKSRVILLGTKNKVNLFNNIIIILTTILYKRIFNVLSVSQSILYTY